MITNSEVLEVHCMIIRVFLRQGIDVYFAVVGGQHQCCLSFDNRVLFEGDNHVTLPHVFYQWCDDDSVADVGRRIATF